MPLDKKALKTRLLEQYAEQLDEILDGLDNENQLHLTEIENIALKLRYQVGQSVTESLATNESHQQEVDVICPDCQEHMRYKGRKAKWIKTRSGEIKMERPYYYCDHCKTGHFPPG